NAELELECCRVASTAVENLEDRRVLEDCSEGGGAAATENAGHQVGIQDELERGFGGVRRWFHKELQERDVGVLAAQFAFEIEADWKMWVLKKSIVNQRHSGGTVGLCGAQSWTERVLTKRRRWVCDSNSRTGGRYPTDFF
ncbi:hypothetical protein INO08_14900, partial [Staphylococcus aureus]|nr:hypothetical protein [Staphylococcus aureus]